jgi:hypothetical protein
VQVRRLPRWLGIVAIVAGVLLLIVFGVRSWRQYQFTQRVAAGQIQVESLRGWMTLPYIARVYGVPESQLRASLGLPATGGDDRSLGTWLSLQGIDPLEGRRRIEALILSETARHGSKGG